VIWHDGLGFEICPSLMLDQFHSMTFTVYNTQFHGSYHTGEITATQ